MRFIDSHFIRFIIVGAMNTAIGYGLYCALLLMFPYFLAYGISYVVGIGISYVLNCTFVFQTRLSLRGALQFPLVYVVQYALGTVLLWLFVTRWKLDPRIAALLVVAFSVPITFVAIRFVVRRVPQQPQGTGI